MTPPLALGFDDKNNLTVAVSISDVAAVQKTAAFGWGVHLRYGGEFYVSEAVAQDIIAAMRDEKAPSP